MPGTPTTQDFYDIGLAAFSSRNGELVVRRGDVSDAQLMACATMSTMVAGSAAAGFRSTLVLGGRGNDLTITCHDRGVDRLAGSKSIGSVTFSRGSAGAGGTILAGAQVATQPDELTGLFSTFTTDADVTFGPTDLAKSVSVTCTVTGASGNVEAAAIERVLSTTFATFNITNPSRLAGGNDPEGDEDLQVRTTQFPLTLRRGTDDALEFAAKLVPQVKRVTIVGGGGPITMYVSDANGNSNPTMAAAVSAIVEGPPSWRAAGDIVNVVGASLFLQNIDMSVTLASTADPNLILPKIAAAVAARMKRYKPGGTIIRENLSSAGEAVDQTSIVSVKINVPPVDIVLTSSQVPAAGDVTFS